MTATRGELRSFWHERYETGKASGTPSPGADSVGQEERWKAS